METVAYLLLIWLGAEAAIGDDSDELQSYEINQQYKAEHQRAFIFEEGFYYKNIYGYYISNLQHVLCESNIILISDLTVESASGPVIAKEIVVGCSNV